MATMAQLVRDETGAVRVYDLGRWLAGAGTGYLSDRLDNAAAKGALYVTWLLQGWRWV